MKSIRVVGIAHSPGFSGRDSAQNNGRDGDEVASGDGVLSEDSVASSHDRVENGHGVSVWLCVRKRGKRTTTQPTISKNRTILSFLICYLQIHLFPICVVGEWPLCWTSMALSTSTSSKTSSRWPSKATQRRYEGTLERERKCFVSFLFCCLIANYLFQLMEAQGILAQFKDHPQAWTRADKILENVCALFCFVRALTFSAVFVIRSEIYWPPNSWISH